MSDIVDQTRDAANRHEARGNTDTADLLDKIADEIERLRADLARVTAERDEAKVIVDRVAKRTRDGVLVIQGDKVWTVYHGRATWFCVDEKWRIPMAIPDGNGDWHDRLVEDCYSTREAAEAAKDSNHD